MHMSSRPARVVKKNSVWSQVKKEKERELLDLDEYYQLQQYRKTGLTPKECQDLVELCHLYDKLGINPQVLKGLLTLYELLPRNEGCVKRVYMNDIHQLCVFWNEDSCAHQQTISI